LTAGSNRSCQRRLHSGSPPAQVAILAPASCGAAQATAQRLLRKSLAAAAAAATALRPLPYGARYRAADCATQLLAVHMLLKATATRRRCRQHSPPFHRPPLPQPGRQCLAPCRPARSPTAAQKGRPNLSPRPRCAPHLELSDGEAAAQARLGVVLDRLAMHHGPQRAGSRPREGLGGLLSAGWGLERAQGRAGGVRSPWWAGGVASAGPTPVATPRFRFSPARRRTLRAGWLNQVRTRNCHFFLKCWLGMTLLCFTIVTLCGSPAGLGGRGGEASGACAVWLLLLHSPPPAAGGT
jgi:hypothetical protein